jgi:hypothetical protein
MHQFNEAATVAFGYSEGDVLGHNLALLASEFDDPHFIKQ